MPTQEQDNIAALGDASDDDQMVICEEPPQEIDLKCKEKVTDSDSESQSDMEPSIENRVYQRRYSPVTNTSSGEITCRPKPIKACLTTSESSIKFNSNSKVLNIPYHSPVNPTGISGFQPTGGGAFKTMPASPKIIKNEVKAENSEWTAGSFLMNTIKNESPSSPAGIVITKITTDCTTKWITTIAKTPTSTKPTTTFAILKSQMKPTNIIQVGDPGQFQRQQMTLLLNSNQSTTLCLTSDTERTHPVVAVVASSPSDQTLQYVYMHPTMQIVPKNTPQSVIVSQSPSRRQSNNHELSPVQNQITNASSTTFTNSTGRVNL